MLRVHLFRVGLIIAVTVGLSLWGHQRYARADGTAWFSSDQVASGGLAYGQNCAVCHGAQLEGGGAPALVGRTFNAQWNGKTVAVLYNYIHQNMPLGKADSLPPQQYADITAFVLSRNGLQAGTQQFTPSSPMGRVLTLAGSPGGGAPPPAQGPVKLNVLIGPLKQPTTAGPTQAELDAADTSTTNWLMYNKGYRSERYSSLDRINTANASRMRPVCMYQLGELGTFEAGPVMYRGVLYATTHLGTYAIDATTCKKLWSHQHTAQGPEMNATNKGVAIAEGRIIRGTQDGFLYALDAKTGAQLWLRQVTDWTIGEGVGAAPLVWNGLVFIGKAGGDWGIHGHMMAFHLKDGSPAWAFDLIPTGNETGAHTWRNPQSAQHGGGAAWTAYALDRASGTLFIPVGNPGPDFKSDMRPGANLFTNSVVALDARTGKLKWYSQLRPNDDHDWDTTNVALFDSGGNKYVAASGKGGILHVFRRDNGKPVFQLAMTTLLNQNKPLTPLGVRVCPVAGVQWNGAAHSPRTDLLYVNAIDWCSVFKSGPDPKWVATVPYTGLANGFGTNDPPSKWSGWINAVNPKTGKMAWRIHRPTPMYAALAPTGGNVLFTGDLDGEFLALDARNGSTLFRFNTGGPIAGGVITYAQGGKQYVAVASGHSGGSIPLTGSATIVVFGQ
jgi:alcohol dehydrogenase (cytochrome c)